MRNLFRKKPRPAKLHSGDELFAQDLRVAMLAQSTPGAFITLYLIAATLLIGLIWASLANVEEVTRAEGRVKPSSHQQIVQSLEGGLIQAILVKAGQVVEKGQPLLQIDRTITRSALREGQSKALSLQGSVARLRAESYDSALIFPPEVQAMPDIVRNETQAYQARRNNLEQGVRVLQRSLALSEREIALSANMVKQGLLSEVELLKMKRQANDFRLQIAERKTRYRADANEELVKLESELAQLSESTVARQDALSRTLLVSPMKGTVKSIRPTTLGSVIQQGADIMEIVPFDDDLLIEAKIQPSDVAFLRPGLVATLKFSAYDYAIYGGLSGVIEDISPDTLEEEKNPTPGKDNTYYRVIVRADKNHLNAGDRILPVIPGMTVTVDIKTGEKSILHYLLKPVMKSREAFRER